MLLCVLNKTIRENIDVYGEFTDCEIIQKMSKFGLGSFINNYKNGLNEQINIDGSNLSGGEKQKIILGRTLLKKSKILILDEATSHLDQNTLSKFLDALVKTTNYHFIFIVSHQKEVLEKMDIIINIVEGKVQGHE